jgi:hypothetical protein
LDSQLFHATIVNCRQRQQAPNLARIIHRYAETHYAANSSGETDRRVVARIEATSLGLDIRFVVTSLKGGSADHVYDALYCARGQAEDRTKRHKAQVKIDRTSCRSANANLMWLSLHTAAYWLMWRLRQVLPQSTALRATDFATIRLRLIKVAARVIEAASCIHIAFSSACPDAKLFRHVALSLRAASA